MLSSFVTEIWDVWTTSDIFTHSTTCSFSNKPFQSTIQVFSQHPNWVCHWDQKFSLSSFQTHTGAHPHGTSLSSIFELERTCLKQDLLISVKFPTIYIFRIEVCSSLEGPTLPRELNSPQIQDLKIHIYKENIIGADSLMKCGIKVRCRPTKKTHLLMHRTLEICGVSLGQLLPINQFKKLLLWE